MGSYDASADSKMEVEILLGGIQFGKFANMAGREPPFATVEQITPMLDAFQAHGHNRFDTARIYGGGGSERLLGDAKWQDRGLKIGTKLHPTKSRFLGPQNVPYSHNAEDLAAGLTASLGALQSEFVDTFYLYAPDRTVSFEETLFAIHTLYLAGRFRRWGLCKFPAWEVALINQICTDNNWVRPSVYQGIYNPILRQVEAELLPCLRYYRMAFEAAQPTASGLLTSRYRRDMPDSEHEPGRRFDPAHFIGRHNRERYWYAAYFDALDVIREAATAQGLSELECTLRWMKHHSKIDAAFGDGMVVCASTVEQLEEQLVALKKGRLPEEVVQAFDKAWAKARCQPYSYHL
jgi:aflatoxin B1 aldehyde reductase